MGRDLQRSRQLRAAADDDLARPQAAYVEM